MLMLFDDWVFIGFFDFGIEVFVYIKIVSIIFIVVVDGYVVVFLMVDIVNSLLVNVIGYLIVVSVVLVMLVVGVNFLCWFVDLL